MSTPPIKTRQQLTQEWIQRFLTYTDQSTWFGPNSVMRAWALTTATAVEGCYLLYTAILRRLTLMAASGDYLTQVASERGCERLGATSAKLLVVFQPAMSNVTAVTVGPPDKIEVDDSSPWLVGDSGRIRNADGTVTEAFTIAAITIGTGPNGGDEFETAVPLTNAYTPGTEDVDVLMRVSVPAGTTIESSSGAQFQTLTILTTGDANPVLDGESAALALADKTWCEAVEKGDGGNIDPLSVTALTVAIRGVLSIFNPDAGTGGSESESDFALKYRTMQYPTIQNQETHAWIQALAQAGNSDVIRAVKITSTTVGVMAAKVLKRDGGGFTAGELTAIEAYMDARVRSYMTVELTNVTLTSVEVEGIITLDAGATLEDVWKKAAAALAIYLDWRKWGFGALVPNGDLFSTVNATQGIATLETSSFLPAADVTVGLESLPALVRLSLQDSATGDTINATLATSF